MVSTPEPRERKFFFCVKPNSLVGPTLQQLIVGDTVSEQWSGSPQTQNANEWTDMYEETFRIEPPGKGIHYYFCIKYMVYALSATADIDERIQARNNPGYYGNISDELHTDNLGVTGTTIYRKTCGVVCPRNLGAGAYAFDEQPFDVKIQLRTNEANMGRLRVSSISYVEVLWEER